MTKTHGVLIPAMCESLSGLYGAYDVIRGGLGGNVEFVIVLMDAAGGLGIRTGVGVYAL